MRKDAFRRPRRAAALGGFICAAPHDARILWNVRGKPPLTKITRGAIVFSPQASHHREGRGRLTACARCSAHRAKPPHAGPSTCAPWARPHAKFSVVDHPAASSPPPASQFFRENRPMPKNFGVSRRSFLAAGATDGPHDVGQKLRPRVGIQRTHSDRFHRRRRHGRRPLECLQGTEGSGQSRFSRRGRLLYDPRRARRPRCWRPRPSRIIAPSSTCPRSTT